MKIAVTEFKAKCLKLIDQLDQIRDPIVLTKRGKPVAKLVPIDNDENQTTGFGYMAGSAIILGDIISPIDESWGDTSGDEDPLYSDLAGDTSEPTEPKQ